MSASDVIELLQLLGQDGIEVYVDGGWAVDALLGEQTRAHRDLDIALPHRFVGKMRELLGARGYKDIPRGDSWECNFVLGDDKGHEVDVHSYILDDHGNNVYGVPYEARHLTGIGSISGYSVTSQSTVSAVWHSIARRVHWPRTELTLGSGRDRHSQGFRLLAGVLYYPGLAAAQGGSTDRRAPAKSSAILRDFCADTDLAARCQRASLERTRFDPPRVPAR